MSRLFDSSQTGVNAELITTPSSSVYNSLNAMTYAAWINPKSAGGNSNGVMFVKDPVNTYGPYITFDHGMTLASLVADSTFTNPAFSEGTTPIVPNVWTHVAMTFDINGDKKVHIYINGVEDTYTTHTALVGVVADDSAVGILIGNDTFDDGWNGNIAELAAWNTVLTQPQLTSLAASTTGAASIQSANLVGYWHLCGTMSPEPDASGNGNNGVLSSNPPTQGSNSPGFNCSSSTPYSVPDCRDYATFPNASRNVNGTLTYDVQTSSNPAVPSTDSRTAGAPVACGTYPQNSRAPGTFGPGE